MQVSSLNTTTNNAIAFLLARGEIRLLYANKLHVSKEIPNKFVFFAFWMSLMFINKSNFKKVMQWHGFTSATNGTWRESTGDDRFMARVFLTADSLLKHLGRCKSGLSQQ